MNGISDDPQTSEITSPRNVMPDKRNNPSPKLAELARDWEDVKFLVAKAALRMNRGFYRSLRYWQQGDFWQRKEWSLCELGDNYAPRSFHEPHSTVFIGGDCRGKLTLQNGGLVQICGN